MYVNSWRGALVLFAFSGLARAQAATDPSIVAWWPADGDTSDLIRGCAGLANGGVTYQPGVVGLGQAFAFDGVSGVVTAPDGPELELTTSLTIECWVKRQNPDHIDFIVEKGGDWNVGVENYGLAIHTNALGNRLYFTFHGGGRWGPSIADTLWHHVAVTANNGDQDPQFWLDGSLQLFNDVDEVPVSPPATVSGRFGAATIDLAPSTRDLHIGALLDPNPAGVYYGSLVIDELSIYSTVLPGSEIQSIYLAGTAGKAVPPPPPLPSPVAVSTTGLVSWYRGDASGSSVQDETGVNDGQLLGTPLGSGYVGISGFVFDDDGDRIVIPHDDTLNPDPVHGFTVEFWMKGVRNLADPLFDVVEKSHGFIDNAGWSFQGDQPNGNLGWLIMRGGGPPYTNIAVADSTQFVLDNCWHHIAGTWDALDGRMRFYVDGFENLGDIVTGFPSNQRDLNVGFAWGGGSPQRFFRGSVDELTIYDRTLSTAEIQAIFDAGPAGKDATAPPADSDGDGLTDAYELQIGTDPYNADTDGDGLSDKEEVDLQNLNGGIGCPDPRVADSDMDGLSDYGEVNAGLDPCDGDTDGDGLADGVEILTYGTNPLAVDTDNDGLSDGMEVAMAMAEGSNCPNPLYFDSDGDGWSDGMEVNRLTGATDPCKSDTDGDGIPDPDDLDPLNPPQQGYVAGQLRDYSAYVSLLSIGDFSGPNVHAQRGLRGAMSNKLAAIAGDVDHGNYQGALDALDGLLSKLDGQPMPTDWMVAGPTMASVVAWLGDIRLEIEYLQQQQ